MPGGWADSKRRERLPADWAAIVRQVKARSGGLCEVVRSSGKRCGRPADGGVDHKIAGADDDRLEALQDTCRWHHRAKTTKEGQQAKADKAASRKRPEEQHPGSIRRKP
jgi:5-methylcytosine-specific restriction protein A